MILGSLKTIQQELLYYPASIRKGIQFLISEDLDNKPVGEYEIDGRKIYAKVMVYDTEPKVKRRPERHDKYIDIQCVISGKELICGSGVSDVGQVDDDKLAEKDIIYYKDATNEVNLVLTPKTFAVYFPWDVHRPNCAPEDKIGTVKKIVVKVALSSLEEE